MKHSLVLTPLHHFLPSTVTHAIDDGLDALYSLDQYVAPTVCLVPSFIKDPVENLSEATGFDQETLNYTLGLLMCYPLGYIMHKLPYGKIKHLFSFFLGVFLLQFTLGVQWIHQLITSLIVYLMFCTLSRKTTKTLVPVFVMVYLTLGHLHRLYINYLGYDLDFTGVQMVTTQKLYMMAYNLHDGEILAKGTDADRAAKKCAKFALQDTPGLLEYLGYTFCFANILAGPAYEFKTYMHACNGNHLYNANGKPHGKIPSNAWPTIRPFLVSLVNMALYVVLSATFPLHDPVDPQNNTPTILTKEFLALPWIQRYAYMWVGLLGVRQKYYFAWSSAEGANNIWYAGFEGFDEDGNAKGWENSSNNNIWAFETAPNCQTLSKEWNKKTSLWLSRYVYIRTNGNLAAVYSLSAFWHGFYPGYYLFFLSVPLLTACERLGRKKISPYFSKEKWSLYGIACILTTSFFVEYIVSAFVLLSFEWSVNVYKSHFFFGHIGCAVFYVVLSMIPSPKKKEE